MDVCYIFDNKGLDISAKRIHELELLNRMLYYHNDLRTFLKSSLEKQ